MPVECNGKDHFHPAEDSPIAHPDLFRKMKGSFLRMDQEKKI